VADLIPGWEIAARKTNGAWMHLAFIVLQMLLIYPPENRSSVTFTLRNRDTGAVRKVTAKSLEEAALRAAAKDFDRA
jgi:hypothetical protein